MEIKSILKDFSKLAEARRNYTFRTKILFLFTSLVIAMVLFFTYSIVNNAMNKILVVNEGGEFVHFKAQQQDLLYESLLKSLCYYTSYYINSFDRLSIEENQARALFLVNRADANTIFAKYQADRAYGDAIELGVAYKTEFEGIQSVSVSGEEYYVVFTSILTIHSSSGTKQFRITSSGTAIRTTPRFPENVTGFFFKNYSQNYSTYQEQ